MTDGAGGFLLLPWPWVGCLYFCRYLIMISGSTAYMANDVDMKRRLMIVRIFFFSRSLAKEVWCYFCIMGYLI